MKPELKKALENSALPLVPYLDMIADKLAKRRLAVLRADPGSGKSTLTPLVLADRSEFQAGRVVVLEPRRLAAVSVASRMAELSATELGALVGYTIRLDSRVSSSTRIEVVTEGVLVQRLLRDPFLDAVSAIVFDEFHERSVESDLALALTLELRKLRPELAVLLMSASLDAAEVAEFLTEHDGGGKVPAIECSGSPFPVSVAYRPMPVFANGGGWGGDRAIGNRAIGNRAIGNRAAQALLEEIGHHPSGDILLFLPGRREIADAVTRLKTALPEFELCSLHGSLSLEEQRRVVAGSGSRRRIVAATNIAETSLTVPAVEWVIDSGWVRLERYHQASGLDRLSLEPISRRSAIQRAGRAGRTGPGACLRLWAEHEYRPLETDPAIRRVELSGPVLAAALWGIKDRQELSWLTPPPEAAWTAAEELLRSLGALDSQGRPSAFGGAIAALGLPPRLAALVYSGAADGYTEAACATAALLSERDPPDFGDDPDLRLRLSRLRRYAEGGGAESSDSGTLTAQWAKRCLALAADIERRLDRSRRQKRRYWKAADEALIGSWIASGFPDRVAARQDSGVFRFPSGREARTSGVLAEEAWLAVAAADAGERLGFIRLAAPINETDALKVLGPRLDRRSRVEWDALRPRLVSTVSAGRLVISQSRSSCPPAELADAFAELLAERGLTLLPWKGASCFPERLLQRVRFLVSRSPASDDPDWTDEGLIRDALAVFGPFLSPKGEVLSDAGLSSALRARIGRRLTELDALVPESWTTPAGVKRRIDYSGMEPAIDVKIQELFGEKDTPRVLGAPVLLRLLSPAERPLQLTRDLAGFWNGAYIEIRKEMRGRYPRHHWPDDPLNAEPSSRPKRRR